MKVPEGLQVLMNCCNSKGGVRKVTYSKNVIIIFISFFFFFQPENTARQNTERMTGISQKN